MATNLIGENPDGKRVCLMFHDESRYGRINEPKRCWASGEIRPNAPSQFVREFTHALAALSPHDGKMDSLILPRTDAESMSLLIEEVSSRHLDEFILMIMDGAGWHKAGDLRVPRNMKPAFLPPYSPQLNPVENLWEEIREKWFGNRVFKDLNAVEDTLVEALATLEGGQTKGTGYSRLQVDC